MSDGDSVETAEPPRGPVICDAGPIIHLDELDCLDLLRDFPEVIVPVAVRREVQRHRPEALDRPQTAWRAAAPGEPPSAELRALVRLLALHVGETAAIQIAMGHPGAMLLTDDTAARLAARSLGIRVHGTLGLLVRAIRRGQRSRREIAGILADVPHRSSLHVRPGLLMSVIREVEAKDSP